MYIQGASLQHLEFSLSAPNLIGKNIKLVVIKIIKQNNMILFLTVILKHTFWRLKKVCLVECYARNGSNRKY